MFAMNQKIPVLKDMVYFAKCIYSIDLNKFANDHLDSFIL